MDSNVEPALTEILKEQLIKELSMTHFDKICRGCLSVDTEETAYIFEVTYENITLWEIFKNCAAVQIDHNDSLPMSICKSCITTLVQIYTFKQQCQRSDAILRAVVKEQKEILPTDQGEVTNTSIAEETAKLDIVKLEDENIVSNNSKGVSPSRPRRNDRSKKYKYKSRIQKDSDKKGEKIQKETIEDDDNTVTDKEEKPKAAITCNPCNLTFNTYNELKIHRKQTKHPRPRNYKCLHCGKAFSYSHLLQHMRTHTKEKPFPCHVCQIRFSLKCNLRRHMMVHTGERPHICDICGKGFIQATSLVDHKRRHTGETPFVCSYCGLGFAQSSRHKAHLTRHLIESGNTENTYKAKRGIYQCDVCHKQFMTRGVLKTHELTHGEKSFLCSECGKGFVSNAGLLSHMKVHTGVKPYPCTVCNKAFSQLGSLKSHILIHTGQKPFNCKVCSKAFTQRNHLKYHMMTHSGERPYVCMYCEKSFALKGTLTIHVRTHTGETPYICDFCGKGFYDSSSMKKHKRGHGSLEGKKIVNRAVTVSQEQKNGS